MIWNWFVYSIPWEVKLGAGVFVVVVALIFLKQYWREILAAGAVIGGAVLLNRAQQQGYRTRQAEEKADADRTVQAADDARRDADAHNAAPGGLRDDDGFRRD